MKILETCSNTAKQSNNKRRIVKHTFKSDDVTVLLTELMQSDITYAPEDLIQQEKLFQTENYGKYLTKEYIPRQWVQEEFEREVESSKESIARDVYYLADRICNRVSGLEDSREYVEQKCRHYNEDGTRIVYDSYGHYYDEYEDDDDYYSESDDDYGDYKCDDCDDCSEEYDCCGYTEDEDDDDDEVLMNKMIKGTYKIDRWGNREKYIFNMCWQNLLKYNENNEVVDFIEPYNRYEVITDYMYVDTNREEREKIFSQEELSELDNMSNKNMFFDKKSFHKDNNTNYNDNPFILVSLARAGLPLGILLKKAIKYIKGVDVPHYSISLIKEEGLDKKAMHEIIENHPESIIIFVDGWTGKGSIKSELDKYLNEFRQEYTEKIKSGDIKINPFKILNDYQLAVLYDPAFIADIYASREDKLVPYALLNATISGLISRTVIRDGYNETEEYYGAIIEEHLREYDKSQWFIDKIYIEIKRLNLKERYTCKFIEWSTTEETHLIYLEDMHYFGYLSCKNLAINKDKGYTMKDVNEYQIKNLQKYNENLINYYKEIITKGGKIDLTMKPMNSENLLNICSYIDTASIHESFIKSEMDVVKEVVKERFKINIKEKFIKFSIGETLRVLLRRNPAYILINKNYIQEDENDKGVEVVKKLAEERNVEIIYTDLHHYKVGAILEGFQIY